MRLRTLVEVTVVAARDGIAVVGILVRAADAGSAGWSAAPSAGGQV